MGVCTVVTKIQALPTDKSCAVCGHPIPRGWPLAICEFDAMFAAELDREVFLPTDVDGYEVSNFGAIRNTRTGELLSPWLNDSGYPKVNLGARSRQRYVHLLVLEAWEGKRPAGMQTCHQFDVKSDNWLAHLRFGTPGENVLDRVRNGIHPMANRTRCPAGHEYTPENTRVYQGSRYCKACKNERSKQPRKNLPMPRIECIHGHRYTEANTYIHPKSGARSCRACTRRRRKEWRDGK